jgi:5-methylcytosine-specific restriction protein A
MPETLEERFHRRLESSYWEVGKATSYWASRFLQKVRRVGGLQAAREWLDSKKDSAAGLDRVVSVGRPELSLEGMVLEDEWKELFTPEERRIARERLDAAISRHRGGHLPGRL